LGKRFEEICKKERGAPSLQPGRCKIKAVDTIALRTIREGEKKTRTIKPEEKGKGTSEEKERSVTRKKSTGS